MNIERIAQLSEIDPSKQFRGVGDQVVVAPGVKVLRPT
jgi:hypothetical protein